MKINKVCFLSLIFFGCTVFAQESELEKCLIQCHTQYFDLYDAELLQIQDSELKQWLSEEHEKTYDLSSVTKILSSLFLYRQGSRVFQKKRKKMLLQIYYICQNAENDKAEAMYLRGFLHQQGFFLTANLELAKEWYNNAALAGHNKALWLINNVYDRDRRPSEKQVEMIFWFAKNKQYLDEWWATKPKSYRPYSLHKIKTLLLENALNPSPEKEKELTLQLYSIWWASELYEANAMYMRGWLYENGICFNKDLRQAEKWYKKAKEQGFPQHKKYQPIDIKNGQVLVVHYMQMGCFSGSNNAFIFACKKPGSNDKKGWLKLEKNERNFLQLYLQTLNLFIPTFIQTTDRELLKISIVDGKKKIHKEFYNDSVYKKFDDILYFAKYKTRKFIVLK